MFPCFGAIDIHVGVDIIPSTTKPNPKDIPWDGSQYVQQYQIRYLLPNSTAYFLFVAKKTYSGQPVSAVFQFVAWTSPLFSLFDTYPYINNNTLTATIVSKGGNGTIKWQKTSNRNDNYTVWYSDVNSESFNSDNTGNYSLTGCSVQRFFHPFTKDISIKDNGDGTMTASISNLNSTVITPVTVVVSREGGSSAAYQTIYFNNASFITDFTDFNNASFITFSWAALLLALFALVFN
eukprot:TRINITY_DN4900_c0_g1_i5.p1 TRINITY_DN4900_c0_g1~~TRINITY_DN4900_c0_g1_i5.p1  ORF type:complete len:236 (+),score=48.89 TRINITY_DN4900_c0_g1_i5:789-1496(+)